MHEFRNIDGPHLVMVPKTTLANWCNEFKFWCPVLRILRFHGTKEERAQIAQTKLKPGSISLFDVSVTFELYYDFIGKTQNERDWDVVITTYEVVNLEKSALCKIAWKYLIIDEAHRLKNEASQVPYQHNFSYTLYPFNICI